MKRDKQYWLTKLTPLVVAAVALLFFIHVAIHITKVLLGIPPS